MLKLLPVIMLLFSTAYGQYPDRDTVPGIFIGEILPNEAYPIYNFGSEKDFINMQDHYRYDIFKPTDALSYKTGIYSTSDSMRKSMLFMRGYSTESIKVMIDGAPILLPFTGNFDLSQIAVTPFRKISIIKNPRSIYYGPNSPGGVINLISDELVSGLNTDINIHGGNNEGYIKLNHSGIWRSFYWGLSSNYLTSNGYDLPNDFPPTPLEDGFKRVNSQEDIFSFFVKAGVKNELSNVFLSFLNMNNSMGIPIDVFAGEQDYRKVSDWKKNMFNFSFKSQITYLLNLNGNFYYDDSYYFSELYDDIGELNPDDEPAESIQYNDYAFGSRINTEIQTIFYHPTRFSLQYFRNVHTELRQLSKSYSRIESETISLGTEQDFAFDKKSGLSAGFSFDYMKILYTDKAFPVTGNSAFNYYLSAYRLVNEKIRVFGSFNSKSRFPTLLELYSTNGGSFIPNPELTPELSNNFELGASISILDFELNLTGFKNNLKDYIIPEKDGNKFHYKNESDVDIHGVEARIQYSEKWILFEASYSYAKSVKSSESNYGEKLPYRPEHTAKSLLKINLPWGSNIQPEFFMYKDRFAYNNVKLDDYFLINFKISQTLFESNDIYIRINNITDELYQSMIGYPMPGFSFAVGINFMY